MVGGKATTTQAVIDFEAADQVRRISSHVVEPNLARSLKNMSKSGSSWKAAKSGGKHSTGKQASGFKRVRSDVNLEQRNESPEQKAQMRRPKFVVADSGEER